MFQLHQRLANDCVDLGSFALCRLLLMRDANYPWFILVPRRPEVTEIFQLSQKDQQQLLAESSYLGEFIMGYFNGDKLNVAALGNVVPQLHVHHIVRHHGDPAWPGPVWGAIAAKAYDQSRLNQLIQDLTQKLAFEFTPAG